MHTTSVTVIGTLVFFVALMLLLSTNLVNEDQDDAEYDAQVKRRRANMEEFQDEFQGANLPIVAQTMRQWWKANKRKSGNLTIDVLGDGPVDYLDPVMDWLADDLKVECQLRDHTALRLDLQSTALVLDSVVMSDSDIVVLQFASRSPSVQEMEFFCSRWGMRTGNTETHTQVILWFWEETPVPELIEYLKKCPFSLGVVVFGGFFHKQNTATSPKITGMTPMMRQMMGFNYFQSYFDAAMSIPFPDSRLDPSFAGVPFWQQSSSSFLVDRSGCSIWNYSSAFGDLCAQLVGTRITGAVTVALRFKSANPKKLRVQFDGLHMHVSLAGSSICSSCGWFNLTAMPPQQQGKPNASHSTVSICSAGNQKLEWMTVFQDEQKQTNQ